MDWLASIKLSSRETPPLSSKLSGLLWLPQPPWRSPSPSWLSGVWVKSPQESRLIRAHFGASEWESEARSELGQLALEGAGRTHLRRRPTMRGLLLLGGLQLFFVATSVFSGSDNRLQVPTPRNARSAEPFQCLLHIASKVYKLVKSRVESSLLNSREWFWGVS